jgi:FixJ family two-component response regulator
MTGWEFAEVLKEKIVDSKIILVSGSVSTEEFEKGKIDRFIHAIYEKPISETDLREILGV